jgi:hypothetical protein
VDLVDARLRPSRLRLLEATSDEPEGGCLGQAGRFAGGGWTARTEAADEREFVPTEGLYFLLR